MEFGNALAQIALDLHEAAGFLHPGFGLPRVEIAAASLEKVWQLRRDDRVHATHVGAHRIQFAERTQDIVSVATLGIDRVPYDDLTGALPMAVDTAVPLFHHVSGCRGFRGGSSGGSGSGDRCPPTRHRSPTGFLTGDFRGVGLESGLHGLAIVRIHAAIDKSQSLGTKTLGGEDLLQPLLSGAVLGEQDHPFVLPPVAVLQVLGHPVQQGTGLGIRSTSRLLCP